MMSMIIPIHPAYRREPSPGLFYLLMMLPLAVFTVMATSSEMFARVVIAASVVFPAVILAWTRSTFLLDYFLVVVVFNRELRRIMDWLAGEYDPKPLLSVTPMAVACLMLLVALTRLKSWPKPLKNGGSLIAAGLAYSLALGAFKYKLGAIYGLMDYLMPLSVLFFCVSVRPTAQTTTRWLKTLVTLGMIVAVYGIVQWSVVPEWDRQWVEWSGMWSSMGTPEPFKIRIASTLESRGPASWFLANVAVIMIASHKWRRPWGLSGAALVCGVMILTTARSSWGFVICAGVLLTFLQRGRSLSHLWILGVVVLCISTSLKYLPESQLIQERLSTLRSIQQDGSFQGRLDIARYGVSAVITRPFGFGMGSSGNGGRLLDRGTDGIVDNGYLSLFADLGIPGFALAFYGLVLIVAPVFHRWRTDRTDQTAMLALALIGSSVVGLLIFNSFTTAHASYMWIAAASTFGTASAVAAGRVHRRPRTMTPSATPMTV